MPMLKITSAAGNTTTEEFSPAEMAHWFSRGERALLQRDGRLRQPVGNGFRIVQTVASKAPAPVGSTSRVDGLHYLMVTETNGAEYVMRYQASEMAEIFTEAQLHDLDKGGALIVGNCRYVDMVAAARTVRD